MVIDMMTAEQLKGSILQLAIQGKLVEQRPEEGTGEELYKEIQIDKKKLIKDGSIKEGKKYNAISEEEIMFDIPDTWVWTRLSDIVFNRGQKKPENAFSYIDIGSIDNVHQKLNDEENIIEAENAPSRARKIVAVGDVIYSTVRPYLHNMCIIDREFSHEPIASTGFAAMTCHKGLYNRFLFYYLLSPDFDRYANDTENSKGVAYPAINDQKLYKALVPLPPFAEQKRIVAKIEELMPFVEQYAAASTKLNTLNSTFPEMMKKSILQEAVQGKLVPQDPNDEPASVMLEKIAEEKKRLIKEGMIKKDKKESIIFRGTDGQYYETIGKKTTCIQEQIPFEIPESWEWIRLRSYGQFSSGKTPSMSNPKNWVGDVPWVSPKDMKTTVINDSQMHISQEACDEMTLYPAGTLLMVVRSGILKRKLPLCVLGVDSTINQDVKAFSLYYNELSEWVYYELKGFEHFILHNLVKNVTTVDSLKFDEFQDLLVPVPPRSEQIRIIERVTKLIQSINGINISE